MKTIKKIALAAALFLSVNSFAQDIIDANGDVIAKLDASGVLTDGINQPLGSFLTNGEVRNAEDQLIGSIDGLQFKDAAGIVLGTIDANNDVFDLNNGKIGTVQAGLMVIDANNHVVGRASEEIETKQLAAFFFFFFNNGIM